MVEEGVVGRGCLSRRSQCDAVSLKLSVKSNKAESLICSYSAMILQSWSLGNRLKREARKFGFL